MLHDVSPQLAAHNLSLRPKLRPTLPSCTATRTWPRQPEEVGETVEIEKLIANIERQCEQSFKTKSEFVSIEGELAELVKEQSKKDRTC